MTGDAPSREVERFLTELPDPVEELARALRKRILELVPDAVEKQHGGWKVIGYSVDGSMKTSICAIAPHSEHVNLQFFDGVALEDPGGLLEGTGKRGRHVKCRSLDDVRSDQVVGLIRQAAELASG